MKPKIAILPGISTESGNITMHARYAHAIASSGGVPFLIPTTADREALAILLDGTAGVFFIGGGDVDPARYGDAAIPACGAPTPMRDDAELALFALAWERKLPILGVCRGSQLINVALGGTLWQDLPSQCGTGHFHLAPKDGVTPPASHELILTPGAPLGEHFGKTLTVNSYHHQAVRTPAPALEVTARATDGTVEATWAPDYPYLRAVQWHPEITYDGDPASRWIFDDFVAACRK